ncbi:MAG TPA: Lrp/AsnC family transcriptional regulator, partial [Candidatus Eremiobacteraeota bacterium]|nr:Lrp/AsnC family transcriptional regulator [Candidatus Eremiobacteraeota bacterium]
DKKIIIELQKGIPLESRPFKVIADNLNIKEDFLIERINEFKKNGIIRRFGARLRHYKTEYKENIMIVWNVPEEQLCSTGNLIAKYLQISHCYERPVLPDFPYNLYCMLHGKNREECIKIIEEISELTNIKDYKMLVTVEEYKKISPEYFIK